MTALGEKNSRLCQTNSVLSTALALLALSDVLTVPGFLRFEQLLLKMRIAENEVSHLTCLNFPSQWLPTLLESFSQAIGGMIAVLKVLLPPLQVARIL